MAELFFNVIFASRTLSDLRPLRQINERPAGEPKRRRYPPGAGDGVKEERHEHDLWPASACFDPVVSRWGLRHIAVFLLPLA